MNNVYIYFLYKYVPPHLLIVYYFSLFLIGPTVAGRDIECSLPLDPPITMDIDMSGGYLFGSNPESRIEYMSLPHQDTFEER